MDEEAGDAGCGTLLDELLRCRQSDRNACSLTACPTQTNTFAVCVLAYCDNFPATLPLCTAW